MLFALEWRVLCPTPMEFARHFVELLPSTIDPSTSASILKASQTRFEQTLTDRYFAFCKPSVVGASCVACVLTGTSTLSSSERHSFWLVMARLTDMIDVMDAQNRLIKGMPVCKPEIASEVNKEGTGSSHSSDSRCVSTLTAYSRPSSSVASDGASPVCIAEAARQA